MISQLRVYTVRAGRMEEWIAYWKATMVPLLSEAGIRVEGAWTNEERTQFYWIRSFPDDVDFWEAERAFNRSVAELPKERIPFQYLSRMDVQIFHEVYRPAHRGGGGDS